MSERYSPEFIAEQRQVQVAEVIQYGANGLANQILELIKQKPDETEAAYHVRLKESRSEDFPQIHESVLPFLEEIAHNETAPRSEKEAFLYVLLQTTQPRRQMELVEYAREIIGTGARPYVRERILAASKLAAIPEWYARPTYDHEYQTYVGKCLQAAPSERIAHEREIKEVLLELINRGNPDHVYFFLKGLSLDERERYADLLEAGLERVSFSNNPFVKLNWYAFVSAERRAQARPAVDAALQQTILFKSDVRDDRQQALSYFGVITEAERTMHADQIATIIGELDTEKKYWALSDFFTAISPVERSPYQSMVKKCLQYESNYDRRQKLFASLTSEERTGPYKEVIKNLFEGVESYPEMLLKYYAYMTPEERVLAAAEITTAEDRMAKQWRGYGNPLLDFYGALAPVERAARKDAITKEIIWTETKGKWEDKGRIASLFQFYASLTPAERHSRRSEVDQTLRLFFEDPEYSKETVPSTVVAQFFQALDETEKPLYEKARYLALHRYGSPEVRAVLTPEERSSVMRLQEISRRLDSSVKSEVGDVGMRDTVKASLVNELIRGDLSVILLDRLAVPKERLSITLGLHQLGADVLPALSWRLADGERNALASSLMRVSTHGKQRQLLSELTLPYRPRGRQGAGIEKHIISWFRCLEFVAGNAVSKKEDVTNHIERLKAMQAEAKIDLTTTEVSPAILRGFLQELGSFTEQAYAVLLQSLDVEDVNIEAFKKMIDSWGGEVESLMVLANRLRWGGEAIGMMVAAETKGTWMKERYNCDNSLTAEQLAPLLCNDVKKNAEIIAAYHEGVRFLSPLPETTVRTGQSSEKFMISDSVVQELARWVFSHHHLDQLFLLPGFSDLSAAERDALLRATFAHALPKQKVSDEERILLREAQAKLPEGTERHLVGLRQIIKSLKSGERSGPRVLRAIDGFFAALPEELRAIPFFQNDVAMWLREEVRVHAEAVPQDPEIQARTYLLTHTSDHPKTLLEIGKYPLNSGACQNYDYSDAYLMQSLPGYALDAHIQAIVTRPILLPKEIEQTDHVTIVRIDEGRSELKVRDQKGKEYAVPLNKPIARSILFIGDKAGEAKSIRQENYSTPGAIDPEIATHLQKEGEERLLQKLTQLGVRISPYTKNDETKSIHIAGSHNSSGHYNDLCSGQIGQGGKSYTLAETGSTVEEIYD